MSNPHEVALLVDPGRTYDRKIVRGVAAYVKAQGLSWSLYIEEDPLTRLPDLANWDGDGVLANFDDHQVAELSLQLKIPVVAIGGGYGYYDPASGIPYVKTDNHAISRLAAGHLMDLGLANYAYCGEPANRFNGWAKERESAFVSHLKEAGFDCQCFTGRHSAARHWRRSQEELAAWLRKLPLPVGVMASNDSRARQLLQACRQFRLRVPEDVALVGVDNDDIMCELAKPPLSSIEQGARAVGAEAARLLQILMSGGRPGPVSAVAPDRLVKRGSTDMLAVEDKDLAEAVRFIRSHACRPIRVKDVLEHVKLSRSTLDSRFREAFDRSIHGEIRRVQIDRAVNLLRHSDLPIKEIAREVGASSVQYFSTIVRDATSMTPGELRKQTQITAL